MISIGSLAPEFDGVAVISGSAHALRWEQVHRGRTLVLLFESVQSGSNLLRGLTERHEAVEDVARLAADLYVVCREPACELATSAIPFPLIDDSASEVATLYGMRQAEGTPLWGHCIIDADGFVRRLVQCDVPVSSSLDELIGYLVAAAASDVLDMPC
jgi:hypothetical protein